MTDKLTITVDGKERELFASFGLVNALTKIVTSPDQVPFISVDSELREAVFEAVLAERSPSGKVLSSSPKLDDVEISLEDAERLLEWVERVILGFFLRSLKRTAKLSEENKEVLEGLRSTAASSQT